MSDDAFSEIQARAGRSDAMMCGGILLSALLIHGVCMIIGFSAAWTAVLAVVAVTFAFGGEMLGALVEHRALFAAMIAVCAAVWLAANPAVSLGAAAATIAAMAVYWRWPIRPPAVPPDPPAS